jgi:hypothetical protein
MYVNGKKDLLKLFQEGGREGGGEEMNSNTIYLIYYKNFCNCTMHPHIAQQ